jgi:hypothetical protein
MKNKTIQYLISFLIVTALLATPISAFAKPISPFIGNWQAIDVLDESDLRLVIAGPPGGPFQITWTESYISFCDGGPGIARGTGQLAQDDPFILDADLRLVCFTSGATLDFHMTWIYDPGTDTISSEFITWHRPKAASQACIPHPTGLTNWWPGDGNAADLLSGLDGTFKGDATTGSGLVDLAFHLDGDGDFIEVPHHSALDVGTGDFTVELWVNFNSTNNEQVLVEKWIEQFDPVDGWTLTKLEGNVLRLAMEDAYGNELSLDSGELDLRPGRWYHFAAVRRGEMVELYLNGELIAGENFGGPYNLNSPASLKFGHRGNTEDTPGSLDKRNFYLNGRIDEVELFVGTALSPDQILALYQAGSAGKCKDQIQPPPPLYPVIIASIAGDWFWTSSFRSGADLSMSIYESPEPDANLLWSGVSPADASGYVHVFFQDHGIDLLPGHYLVISDGVYEKSLLLELITMEVFDLENDIMAGTASPGREVMAAAGYKDYQDHIYLIADPVTGQWLADFKTIGVDIVEEMRTWSFAHIYDEDGDANEANPPPAPQFPFIRAHPVWEAVDAWYWPEETTLQLTIDDPNTEIFPDVYMEQSGEVDPSLGSVWFILPECYDLKPGDIVGITDGETTRSLIVSILTIEAVNVDADTAEGIVEPNAQVRLPTPDGAALGITADENGYWFADFKQINFDLIPGVMVIAETYEEDGDMTSYTWSIP